MAPAPGFHYAEQGGPTMSPQQVMALARKYGLPARGIMQIARGESGLRPRVQQHDPGDGMVGYGLLQMTPNAWGKGSAAYRHMQSLGGIRAMADPEKNMAMARFLYRSAGNSFKPWYGTKYLTDRSGEGSLGPVRGGAPATVPISGTNRHLAMTSNAVAQAVTPIALAVQHGAAPVSAPPVPKSLVKADTSQPTPSGQSTQPSDRLDVGKALEALQTLQTSSPGVTTTGGRTSTPSASGGTGGGSAVPKAKGVATFKGKQVAAWIKPILDYARSQGWQGSVNSGYRSLADQTRIYNSGVRPAAKPGTSNHEFTGFPGGAVDVSDAQTLSNILRRSKYAKTLVYAGAKDPVHFSHPHNGGY